MHSGLLKSTSVSGHSAPFIAFPMASGQLYVGSLVGLRDALGPTAKVPALSALSCCDKVGDVEKDEWAF